MIRMQLYDPDDWYDFGSLVGHMYGEHKQNEIDNGVVMGSDLVSNKM